MNHIRKEPVGIFSFPCTDKTEYTVIPKGINVGPEYKVTLDNSGATFTVSGYELMTNGIKIKIPSALSSELILFEAI